MAVKFLISKLSKNLQNLFFKEISIGVIGTAYSNGAFINYVRNVLGLEFVIAKTGVKHSSAIAKNYDIATYFESNGHGTLTYKDSIKTKIEKLTSFIECSKDGQTLELLQIFMSMFNKTVGDSLSALICVESALKLMNMSTEDLFNIYKELEYVNVKVVISDKSIFKPNHDETRLVEPEIFQDFIDETVGRFAKSNGRCFIRPSGTEDIVRIYAEADSLKEAEELAEIVKNKILEKYN
jgi:phosphoacetylglucosamine mutase